MYIHTCTYIYKSTPLRNRASAHEAQQPCPPKHHPQIQQSQCPEISLLLFLPETPGFLVYKKICLVKIDSCFLVAPSANSTVAKP